MSMNWLEGMRPQMEMEGADRPMAMPVFAGQKLVVVGQTAIHLSDIQQFRANFNLPANDPQVVLVPDSKDPGSRPS